MVPGSTRDEPSSRSRVATELGTAVPTTPPISNAPSSGHAPSVDELDALLVIEDSTLDAALICELLTRITTTTRVQVARTLAEALELLPGDFQLVLLDLGLPDGRDLDAVVRVQHAAQELPIIVLTGTEDAELAQRCLECGAQDYVAKHGLDAQTLERAIRYARARGHAQQLDRRLHQTNRLAAVGRLAATVAHEVNNPAAFIQLNTEELLFRVEELEASLEPAAPTLEPEPLRRWLTEVRSLLSDNLDGIERVTRIVRDLNPLAKTTTTSRELVDVTEVCRSILNIVIHHVRHHAQLDLRLAPAPPVRADARRLGQVVMNLLLNATQSLEGPSTHNKILMATRAEGDDVVIVVGDTGQGIEPGRESEIFEPFYSTKAGAENTGLGLSISLEIVQSMGGRIDVESTPGEGTRFSVRLPAVVDHDPPPPDQAPPEAPATAPEPTPVTRRRVMLIDDDPQLLRAMGRSLAKHHDVSPAISAQTALSVLEDDTDFDAIICDLMMPGIDGVDFIERLRVRHPALAERVIVLSGGAATARTAEFVEHTRLPVRVKPCSAEDLNEDIEATVRATEARECTRS